VYGDHQAYAAGWAIMGCHASHPPFLPILGRNYLITGVSRNDLRKMTQTRAAPAHELAPLVETEQISCVGSRDGRFWFVALEAEAVARRGVQRTREGAFSFEIRIRLPRRLVRARRRFFRSWLIRSRFSW
jgi:hypothetical protein